MGVAAYNRGSRGISRDLSERYHEMHPGYRNLDREYIPPPRLPRWGDKAQASAEDKARRILASNRRYGLPVDLELLTAVIVDTTGVGRKTARAAAAAALAEPTVSPLVQAVLQEMDRAAQQLEEPLRTKMRDLLQRRRSAVAKLISESLG